MRRIIALIPVFSQEIANHSRLFCGKPLIYWSLSALEESNEVSHVYVSCENEEVKAVVNRFGFNKVLFVDSLPSTREDLLTNVNCSSEDWLLFLPTASPFFQIIDLEEVISHLQTNEYDTLLSGVKINGTNRLFFQINESNEKHCFIENSVFQLSQIANIGQKENKIYAYEMPEYTLNNYEKDWALAEFVMKKNILSHKIVRRNIRLFATDVDGVLTDAGMYYSEGGEELKKFNTRDGMGLVLLRKEGIKTALITSENTKMVENRAAKLKVDYLYQGKKYGGKLEAILEMCEKENILLENVAYIGDDINCFNALSNVGLAACPADAEPEILAIPNIYVMSKKGGEGCVREFIRMIL